MGEAWALTQPVYKVSINKLKTVEEMASKALQCGRAFLCSSEIPLDLQDTQLSPKATGPGPICHLLFALISTPALHVL